MVNVDTAPKAPWTARTYRFVVANAGRGLVMLAGVAAVTFGSPALATPQAGAGAGAVRANEQVATPTSGGHAAAKHVALPMGGPYEPVPSGEAGAAPQADTQVRSLFLTWKKLDNLQQAIVAVPSAQPIEGIGAAQMLRFSSSYGVRSDPFRHTAAMHGGVDLPGAVGTPVYATADGVVGRAERAGGYGNLVELEHGKGIQTRYGHLSKILVEAGTHVQRGQIIALMGSTGRSTGSHLHYEVRLDGHAVNPVPFLPTGEYQMAMQNQPQVQSASAVGGPEIAD